MAIKDDILNLFPDNAMGQITAADLREFVNAIFDNKENKIYKISDIVELPTINTNVYEDDLIIIKDGENKGIYRVKINNPSILSDLELIINGDIVEIPPLPNNSETYALIANDNNLSWVKYGNFYIAGRMNISDILQITPDSVGVMYVANDTNETARVPGKVNDVYSWNGCDWANIGNIFCQEKRYRFVSYNGQSDFVLPESIPYASLIFIMGSLQSPETYTINDNILHLNTPLAQGTDVLIQF